MGPSVKWSRPFSRVEIRFAASSPGTNVGERFVMPSRVTVVVLRGSVTTTQYPIIFGFVNVNVKTFSATTAANPCCESHTYPANLSKIFHNEDIRNQNVVRIVERAAAHELGDVEPNGVRNGPEETRVSRSPRRRVLAAEVDARLRLGL